MTTVQRPAVGKTSHTRSHRGPVQRSSRAAVGTSLAQGRRGAQPDRGPSPSPAPRTPPRPTHPRPVRRSPSPPGPSTPALQPRLSPQNACPLTNRSPPGRAADAGGSHGTSWPWAAAEAGPAGQATRSGGSPSTPAACRCPARTACQSAGRRPRAAQQEALGPGPAPDGRAPGPLHTRRPAPHPGAAGCRRAVTWRASALRPPTRRPLLRASPGPGRATGPLPRWEGPRCTGRRAQLCAFCPT